MRRHLFEIHDQPWCPDILRNELTVTLKNGWCLPFPKYFEDWLGVRPMYKIAGNALISALWEFQGYKKQYQVVDICSGSGGPIPMITRYLKQGYRTDCHYILTDLYPNIPQFKSLKSDLISYESKPVDAEEVPKHLSTQFRTSFGSFHHLPEDVARRIFEDVIANRSGIAIFELTGRNIWSILAVALGVPIVGFLSLFRQRFSLLRWMLWLSGIMPLLLIIDGTLSNLRTYEKEDYFGIINSIPHSEELEWKYEMIPVIDFKSGAFGNFFGKTVSSIIEQMLLMRVLTGIPKHSTTHQ
jgi:hypothetical protein